MSSQGTPDARYQAIQKYWDERARESGSAPQATTQDFWMRQVEIRSLGGLLDRLTRPVRILDIGCGNGYSTLELACRLSKHTFVGADYAKEMIEAARRTHATWPEAVRSRVEFEVADVTDLERYRGGFDGVISDRCLINLPTRELQWKAIDQIHATLRPQGWFIAIENFLGGQENLNRMRALMQLPPIAVRWHNLFFDEREFTEHCSRLFELREVVPVSSLYYLVTRVVYSKLCQNEKREPDYDHPIYSVAAELPFEGDYGPIKLVDMVKR